MAESERIPVMRVVPNREGLLVKNNEANAMKGVCFNYGGIKRPCFRKSPGQTNKGAGAGRAALWVGEDTVKSRKGVFIPRANSSLLNSYYRSGNSLGTLVLGNKVFLPRGVISLEVDITEVVFIEKGVSEVTIGLELLGINQMNTDVSPSNTKGHIEGRFFITGRPKRLLEKVWEMNPATRFFVIILRYAARAEGLREIAKGMFVAKQEEAVDLYPYFNRAVELDNCGGAFELGMLVFGLQCCLRGRKYIDCLKRPEYLVLVKAAACPKMLLSVLFVDRKGKNAPELVTLNMRDEVHKLATELDTHVLINDAEFLDSEQGRSAAKDLYIRRGDDIRMISGINWDEIRSSKLVALSKVDPACDWFLLSRGVRDGSYIFPREHSLIGRVPTGGFGGDISWCQTSSICEIPFLPRIMDILGGEIRVSGIAGRQALQVSCFACRETIPRGYTPLLILSEGLKYEALESMAEGMEALRIALDAGGLLVRVSMIKCETVYTQRGRAPVERTSFKIKGATFSGVLTAPHESRVTNTYFGIPLCTWEGESAESRELCARANSLILSSCMASFQYDAQVIAKQEPVCKTHQFGRRQDNICGIPVKIVSGVRFINLTAIEKDSYVLECSEPIHCSTWESQQKILARAMLRSKVALHEGLLQEIYRERGFLLGEKIYAIAEQQTVAVPVTSRRHIPSDEGSTVLKRYMPEMTEIATSKMRLPGVFVGIDSDDTKVSHQVYREIEEGFEFGVVCGTPMLTNPQDLLRVHESGFSSVGEERECWIFRMQYTKLADPVRTKVSFGGAIEFNSLLVQISNNELLTGEQFTRLCAEKMNRWAAEKSLRDERFILSWNPPKAGGPRWSWKYGAGNYKMGAGGVLITQINYLLLLESSQPLVKALNLRPILKEFIASDSVRQPITTLDPFMEIVEEDARETLRNALGSFKTEQEEDIRSWIKTCYKILDSENMHRKDVRSRLLGAIESWRSGNREPMEILREHGWSTEDLTRIFIGEDGADLKIEELGRSESQKVVEGEVKEAIPLNFYEALDAESSRLLKRRMGRIGVRKERPWPLVLRGEAGEMDLFWGGDSERESWRVDPVRQVTGLLSEKRIAPLTEQSIRIERRWETTLSHRLFSTITEIGATKTESVSNAYRAWIESKFPVDIPPAPAVAIKYSIFDADVVEIEGGSGFGVDVEWDPESKDQLPTCIQLGFDGMAAIWTRERDKVCPKWLQELLENEECIKYGFSTLGDVEKIRDLGIECGEIKDLKELQISRGWQLMSLAMLSRVLSGFELKKNPAIRMSFKDGISFRNMTQEQKEYAAEDAIACWALSKRLAEEKGFPEEIAPVLYQSSEMENIWRGRSLRKIWCEEQFPFKYKESRTITLPKAATESRAELLIYGPGFIAEIQIKEKEVLPDREIIVGTNLYQMRGPSWNKYSLRKGFQSEEGERES